MDTKKISRTKQEIILLDWEVFAAQFFFTITISQTPLVSLVSGWGEKKGSFSPSLQVQGLVHYLAADLHFQTRRLSLVEEQPGDNNAGVENKMK